MVTQNLAQLLTGIIVLQQGLIFPENKVYFFTELQSEPLFNPGGSEGSDEVDEFLLTSLRPQISPEPNQSDAVC
jgi:hypothetical protein